MDFHECSNDTDTGPDSNIFTDTASSKFRHVLGAMPSGHDALPATNTTYSAAAALCAKTVACEGFTFESEEAEPTVPVKVYFKTEVTVSGDTSWQSYLKADLPPPKSCDQCTHQYEGQYSTIVYTQHVQKLIKGAQASWCVFSPT